MHYRPSALQGDRLTMTIKGKAYIGGIYEHPTRKADDKSLAQLHAESARGALEDAGLAREDVDGYFCAGDAPGLGGLSMADYMGLKLRHMDTTETGGSSYVIHVAHAAEAIATGKCNVALITLAGRPRAEGMATGTAPRSYGPAAPDVAFEFPFGPTVVNQYAMASMRHMHQYGTTSAQLAWIKVAASQHAQHNPHALLREVVTVEEVVSSPIIADPLHRLDCCVITDGGGALVVRKPGGAGRLRRGRPDAVRREVRVHLRQLHDHGADHARGSRLLSEGTGRQARRRRQPHLRCRPAALQHRWRRPLQQPPRQPRRTYQGGRGGAPTPGRGASKSTGKELRRRPRSRYRRLARDPPRQRPADPGGGGGGAGGRAR